LQASSSEASHADFISLRLSLKSPEDETTLDRLWPLVEVATELRAPRKELAVDWTKIARGWRELGVQLSLVTISELANSVRGAAQIIDELRVSGNAEHWLARFLDIVGECWSKRGSVDDSVLTGMLPDQNRRLLPNHILRHDDGVSDRLKCICAEMGFDVRSELLFGGFNEISRSLGLQYLQEALAKAIPGRASEAEVIDQAAKKAHVSTSQWRRLQRETYCNERQCAASALSLGIKRKKRSFHSQKALFNQFSLPFGPVEPRSNDDGPRVELAPIRTEFCKSLSARSRVARILRG
jgi:hypothetical protein